MGEERGGGRKGRARGGRGKGGFFLIVWMVLQFRFGMFTFVAKWHKRRTSGVVVCRIGRFGVEVWCG